MFGLESHRKKKKNLLEILSFISRPVLDKLIMPIGIIQQNDSKKRLIFCSGFGEFIRVFFYHSAVSLRRLINCDGSAKTTVQTEKKIHEPLNRNDTKIANNTESGQGRYNFPTETASDSTLGYLKAQLTALVTDNSAVYLNVTS